MSSESSPSGSSVRAFFAVTVPESLAGPIADVQAAFADAAGLRPVDPGDAHVTLKFLGDVPAADLDAVVEAGERAVDRAGVGSFECSITGLGVFPSLEYISVVWAGVEEGHTELTRLHEALEAETTALGAEPTDHEFTPHVTLARMDDGRGKELVRKVVGERHPEIGTVEVDSVRLVESTLTDEGPVYDTIETVALCGG